VRLGERRGRRPSPVARSSPVRRLARHSAPRRREEPCSQQRRGDSPRGGWATTPPFAEPHSGLPSPRAGGRRVPTAGGGAADGERQPAVDRVVADADDVEAPLPRVAHAPSHASLTRPPRPSASSPSPPPSSRHRRAPAPPAATRAARPRSTPAPRAPLRGTPPTPAPAAARRAPGRARRATGAPRAAAAARSIPPALRRLREPRQQEHALLRAVEDRGGVRAQRRVVVVVRVATVVA